MDNLKSYYNLFEGGNVFKNPGTVRILKDHIPATLSAVEEILGFQLDQYLGTTGIKESSGDIDVAVDSALHNKKDVANKLRAWATEQGLDPLAFIKLSGDSVHFKTPIRNERGEIIYIALEPQFVQIDLIFGNPEFQVWSLRGEPGNEFKGVHRHIIMASIANAQGKKWNYKRGLIDRITDKVISQDPNTIVRTLLPGYTSNPAELSVKSILDFVYKKYVKDPVKIEKLIGSAAETLAEQYGIMLPMPNQNEVHESNDLDEYFLARLRNRIVKLGYEPLMEKISLNEGRLREINHLEDLILEKGPKGLGISIAILRSFAEGKAQAETTIKWDGSPAIIFGRNKNGEFVLTDKSGFTAKKYDGKVTSAKALGQMFANRNASMDDNRKQFIANMTNIFNKYQKATPPDFRGYLVGDLMYYNTPELEDQNGYVFQPNVVRYEVNKDSKIGKRIGQSKTGIVVHKYVGGQYKSTEEAIKQMQGKEVFVIPPMHIQQPSKIDTKPIDKIEAFAKKHADEIKALFDPAGLKGIANIHTLFYKYINTKVDSNLDDLNRHDFVAWLNTETLTDKKRDNIIKYLEANKVGANALWALIKMIMKLKDMLIREFDSHSGDVHQSINGQKGGEGYVVKHPGGLVKLVSRGTFTAANREAHR